MIVRNCWVTISWILIEKEKELPFPSTFVDQWGIRQRMEVAVVRNTPPEITQHQCTRSRSHLVVIIVDGGKCRNCKSIELNETKVMFLFLCFD